MNPRIHFVDGVFEIGYCKMLGGKVSNDDGVSFGVGLKYTNAAIDGSNVYIKFRYQIHSSGLREKDANGLELQIIEIGVQLMLPKPRNFN